MFVELPLTSSEEGARYRSLGLWRDQTLYEIFRNAVDRAPQKTAIVYGDKAYSYGDLRQLVDALASSLVKLGLEPGQVVALQYKNSPEMPIVHLACNRAGLLYLPLHDSWRELELEHLLRRSRAAMMIMPVEYRGFEHARAVLEIRSQLPDLRHVVTLEERLTDCLYWDDLLARGEEPGAADWDRRRPDPNLPAHTMLSGGTTSLSKISRYSCNDLMVLLDNFAQSAELHAEDIVAGIAPAGTGATGYVFPILTPILHGATSVILERWSDPEDAVELIARHQCTSAVGIPTQLTRMVPPLERRTPAQFENFRLFVNAGAPLPYDTGFKVEALMGCKIQSMYGSTDGGTPVMTTVKDPEEKRLKTVGKVVPGCECELWTPEGQIVPRGQSGEVAWRSADKSWGYLGDDEQTSKTFTAQRFYRSGDLGQFDDEGYLRIIGRVKDMILRGGRNVFPLTIEEQLVKHPSVLEVAVTAMPDPVLGERACAFVVLRDDQKLTFESAVDFLKSQKLAIWQLPERLEIMQDLPRGPGGKVIKSKLTELVTEKLRHEGKF